jgi:Ca-activated chloride channel family protein
LLTGIIDGTLVFRQPFYLNLLVIPTTLFLLTMWRLQRRWIETKRLARTQLGPVRRRYSTFGEFAFWICALIAASLCIAALARPQALVTQIVKGGIDIVILQDGSASMSARDSKPDRWQRALRFLNTLANSLAWKNGDRAALALFAQNAAPQLRLTRDPNALFFFLDQLGTRSPFNLEDDQAWDTNIEEGIYWGLQLVKMDETLFGRKSNAKGFVIISDGQTWTGNVDAALKDARAQDIPVHVVGVGTTGGGLILDPQSAMRIRASLDRSALRTLATAGGGSYFEIDREPDREIAVEIISAIRRRTAVTGTDVNSRDLYSDCLFAAAIALCAGTLLLKHRTELRWHVVTIMIAMGILLAALRGH